MGSMPVPSLPRTTCAIGLRSPIKQSAYPHSQGPNSTVHHAWNCVQGLALTLPQSLPPPCVVPFDSDGLLSNWLLIFVAPFAGEGEIIE